MQQTLCRAILNDDDSMARRIRLHSCAAAVQGAAAMVLGALLVNRSYRCNYLYVIVCILV
eukprot:COSAG02_NODE_2324_length_9133_cov_38.463361_10_plen_60_part_00